MVAAVVAAPTAASAAPNGKTSTYEIGGAAALLYYGVKLGIDNHKADRDGQSAADEVKDLVAARTKVIDAVAKQPDSSGPWRKAYANLTACWNELIYTKGQPADKLDCTAGVKDAAVGKQYDLTDARDAFAAAPSLFQQITDASISTYKLPNGNRVKVLLADSVAFLLKYPPGGIGALDIPTTDLIDDAKNCITSPDLSKCVGIIGKAEGDAATAHRRSVACVFARGNWLPTVTAIRQKTSADTDYGPVPGC